MPLDQVKQRPRRAAFIEEDEDTAITNAKGDGCKCRKTACPLHQLQNTGQLTRLECIADDTVVDQNRNTRKLEIRAHVRAGNEPSTQSQELVERVRIRRRRDQCHDGQILSNADRSAAGCLARAVVSVLARVKLAGTRNLHACVKVENDTAAVAHEIEVGDATESLENTCLLVTVTESTAAARTARHPLALESTHDHLRDQIQVEEFARVAFAEHIDELLALVNRRIVRILVINGQAHCLLPRRIRICEKHTNKNSARHAALVPCVITIRFPINADVNAHELAHGFCERMDS